MRQKLKRQLKNLREKIQRQKIKRNEGKTKKEQQEGEIGNEGMKELESGGKEAETKKKERMQNKKRT